jgi:hypothetical protein
LGGEHRAAALVPGPLLVVWEGIAPHRSHMVKELLATGTARCLWQEQLPGFAPELNTDEEIWSYLKRVELYNLICHDLDHLHSELG